MENVILIVEGELIKIFYLTLDHFNNSFLEEKDRERTEKNV